MQQLMLVNLMMLYCCTVFSAPVRAVDAAGEAAQAESAANWLNAFTESATLELRPAGRRQGRDLAVTVAADEIERFFQQLRTHLNLRPAKPAKDQKSVYPPAAWPETVQTMVILPSARPVRHAYRGGDEMLPQAPDYFLQPVRAGPGRCFA